MARGIDGAAHESALTVSGTATIAVLAGGTDVIYPPEHANLYERISKAGAVVSEIPPDTEPQPLYSPAAIELFRAQALGSVWWKPRRAPAR